MRKIVPVEEECMMEEIVTLEHLGGATCIVPAEEKYL
jgi:hypothetical protein